VLVTPELFVAFVSLLITAYCLGSRKSERVKEKERAEIEARHAENKNAITLVANNMATMFSSMSAFQAWKESHEKQCYERAGNIEKRLDRIMESIDDVRETMEEKR